MIKTGKLLILFLQILFFLPSITLEATERLDEIRLDRFFGGPLALTDSVYPVRGELAYTGSGIFFSIYMHYSIDSGEVYTTFFDEININPQIPFYYEAQQPWTPDDEGDYLIHVWFTGLNGDPVDVPASDTLEIAVQVYDFLPERQLALLESFSSMNCGSCAIINPVIRSLINQNSDRFSMVFYHPMGYEGSPLYLFNPKDHDTRRVFHDVTYSPFAAVGSIYSGNAEAISRSLMDMEHTKPAAFEIEASYHIEDDMLYAQIDTESFANLSDRELRLFVVYTEDSIYFDSPPGSNGEQEFYRVMRSFIPDADGNRLDNQTDGAMASFQLSLRIPLEEVNLNQLELLAFVQDVNSKEVYQAVRLIYEEQDDDNDDNGDDGGDNGGDDDGDDDDGDETNIDNRHQKQSIQVFPNPSAGIINISFDQPLHAGKIVLYNQQGIRVLSESISTHNTEHTFDVSRLDSGLYLLQIHSSDSIITERIFIEN